MNHPVVQQPLPFGQPQGINGEFLQTPAQEPVSAPGWEYLKMVDQLLVHQQIELLEVITGFEMENKYIVKNSIGQQVYFAVEKSDVFERNCCGSNRSFEMQILDNQGAEIIHIHRPLGCKSCCCFCCLQKIEVFSPPGTLIGTVDQKWNILYPNFDVKDEYGNVVLKITGPFCTASMCGNDVEFQIMDARKQTQVGKITKQWSGFAHEAFTNVDNFGITFAMSTDVKIKAVLLSALFLIDFMYFEDTVRNRK